MPALVTDQFRIFNANNLVSSIEDTNNSFYIFLSLPNPTSPALGYGRTDTWNTSTSGAPSPIDNINYANHTYDVALFGKKVTSANVRRLVRRIDWSQGTTYEMYRHDYSVNNPAPITGATRLYDARYYVVNSDFKVYICIDNGSSGTNPNGNASQDEPTFTDLEPSKAGDSGDGYVWKYLYTIEPSDIIKFDSVEYISVPGNWDSSTDAQIQSVRENGDSDLNNNQLKKVYIDDQGFGYGIGLDREVDILGDGTGGKCVVSTDTSGRIVDCQISQGGKGYSYGIVDLGPLQGSTLSRLAKLVPIIPPSRGHGFDLYKELGSDKVLLYARFDDSTKDFPVDTTFAQIGLVRNPTSFGSTTVYTANQFSNLNAVKLLTTSGTITVGDEIRQSVGTSTAVAYVASYDTETSVLKYFQDRSLYFSPVTGDQKDYVGVSSEAKVLAFDSSAEPIITLSGFTGNIDQTFSGITTIINNKTINLGVNFSDGLADPEINKRTGEILYLDNRTEVTRNSRQKEDIKVILEF